MAERHEHYDILLFVSGIVVCEDTRVDSISKNKSYHSIIPIYK